MQELSTGADLAWQIAAHEAAAARFQFIEAEHIFIGICSKEWQVVCGDEGIAIVPSEKL